jgi:hypothetical protein
VALLSKRGAWEMVWWFILGKNLSLSSSPDLSFAIQSFSFKEKAFAPVSAQLDHLAGLLRA